MAKSEESGAERRKRVGSQLIRVQSPDGDIHNLCLDCFDRSTRTQSKRFWTPLAVWPVFVLLILVWMEFYPSANEAELGWTPQAVLEAIRSGEVDNDDAFSYLQVLALAFLAVAGGMELVHRMMSKSSTRQSGSVAHQPTTEPLPAGGEHQESNPPAVNPISAIRLHDRRVWRLSQTISEAGQFGMLLLSLAVAVLTLSLNNSSHSWLTYCATITLFVLCTFEMARIYSFQDFADPLAEELIALKLWRTLRQWDRLWGNRLERRCSGWSGWVLVSVVLVQGVCVALQHWWASLSWQWAMDAGSIGVMLTTAIIFILVVHLASQLRPPKVKRDLFWVVSAGLLGFCCLVVASLMCFPRPSDWQNANETVAIRLWLATWVVSLALFGLAMAGALGRGPFWGLARARASALQVALVSASDTTGDERLSLQPEPREPSPAARSSRTGLGRPLVILFTVAALLWVSRLSTRGSALFPGSMATKATPVADVVAGMTGLLVIGLICWLAVPILNNATDKGRRRWAAMVVADATDQTPTIPQCRCHDVPGCDNYEAPKTEGSDQPEGSAR
ncbi:MAG: hypothetical protein LBV30_05440 [Propionibacteriaceae bacterium]|nr:hypothetical protein [Propionibacteriaceae bacterium]